MFSSTILAAVLALAPFAYAQCGSGSPEGTVTGSGGSYVASYSGSEVYSGSDYQAAIQAALDAIGEGERVSVLADGSIGESTISITSGKTFEGCGVIDIGWRAGRGAIESLDTTGVTIPYLSLTGSAYFAMRFYGVTDLTLGDIEMNLSGGLGIRFERDEAANTNVVMNSIRVTGADSHAVETWNINGLEIGEVIARDVGECGLLIQRTTDANVGLVDGDNVATGTGYATLRFANENGKESNGDYSTNINIGRVKSRGGGRGIFCVSESGAAVIEEIDLADNGGNSILIENCYNVQILGGTVSGGGEVRISARDEFANTRDVSITARVDGTTVRESPCGENITWNIEGDATLDVC